MFVYYTRQRRRQVNRNRACENIIRYIKFYSVYLSRLFLDYGKRKYIFQLIRKIINIMREINLRVNVLKTTITSLAFTTKNKTVFQNFSQFQYSSINAYVNYLIY